MEDNSKNNWGGKRNGSGRKRTNHGKYYGFNSTQEVDAILQDRKKKTEFINAAILEYAKKLGIIP
jgi:hypothetical protein